MLRRRRSRRRRMLRRIAFVGLGWGAVAYRRRRLAANEQAL